MGETIFEVLGLLLIKGFCHTCELARVRCLRYVYGIDGIVRVDDRLDGIDCRSAKLTTSETEPGREPGC